MTMNFPEHPSDGFQIKEPMKDGGHVMWTYSAQFNQWTYEVYEQSINGYLYGDQVVVGSKDVARTSGSQTLNEALSDLDARVAALEAVTQRVIALESALLKLEMQLNESP